MSVSFDVISSMVSKVRYNHLTATCVTSLKLWNLFLPEFNHLSDDLENIISLGYYEFSINK